MRSTDRDSLDSFSEIETGGDRKVRLKSTDVDGDIGR